MPHRFLVLTLALALLASAAPQSAQAWTARKKPPAAAPARAKGKRPKPAAAPPAAPPAPQTSLAARTQAALDRGARLPPGEALTLLEQAVAAREMALAVRLAAAIADSPKAAAAQLVDAASALGQGQDYPVQLRLWQRAHAAGRSHPALRRQIAEGYADALLAAGQIDAADQVLEAELGRTARGNRRSLLDRVVAIGKLRGDLTATTERLRAWRDPDAAVLAAQLYEQAGDDDAAAEELRRAWQTFPGHRGLQAAWLALLNRLGLREELQAAVAQVVRLAPADPMPWLQVLDAHIVARDHEAARKLVDDLARRFPRHDVLLEALIDREQRLGEDVGRIARLYERLLDAAPKEPQYVEAYAEWLLGQASQRAEAEAARVLDRLLELPGGAFAGHQRKAAILLAHNRLAAARAVVQKMAELAPGDPRAERLLALLDERQGRPVDAERRWLTLIALPAEPTPADRSRAAEARQTLASLYRRLGVLAVRAHGLRQRLESTQPALGDALLYLELAGQVEPASARDPDAAWLALTRRLLEKLPGDAELLQAVAGGLVQRGQAAEALGTLETLAKLDPDAAEPLLLTFVEAALARGDPAAVQKGEALLGQGAVPVHVLLRLGDAHLRFGDNDGAAALFRRAATASPHDTRATGRLAALFRVTGALDEEERALREVVLRSVDGDELELAGQRLLTLALAAGRSADIVRWLDAVMPQHPRREIVERFRVSAYDAWLRSAPFDRQLGREVPAIAPSAVGEALASGDLATQVRALRQLAVLGKPVPPALARQLLQSGNAVVRRSTAQALGASGTEAAAKVLVEALSAGHDNAEDVLRAELAALCRLPAVPGTEPVLASMLTRHELAPAAALCLGRIAGPGLLGELLKQWVLGHRDRQAGALVAMAAVAGRHPDAALAETVRTSVLEASPLRGPGHVEPARQAAALWALAALDRPETRAELRLVALHARLPTLRRMAVALLAAPQPPVLAVPAAGVDDGTSADLAGQILRAALGPYVVLDDAALAAALPALDAELADAAGDSAPAACAEWRPAAGAESRLGRLCARTP